MKVLARSGILTLGAMAIPLGLSPAWAQEQNRAADIAAPEGQLEDIVVTATKRQENVQRIPIAVSAFGAEALQRAGVQDTRQLMAIAPSLNLSSTTSDARGVVIRIRGLGSEALNPGLESSVGTVIDGVYRARSNLSLEAVPGIERIELLRGPQGTLFGKNTTSGVVNVITKSPSFTAGGEATVSFGNFDSLQLLGGITGPLVADKLAARIDAVYTRRDGILKDFSTGQRFRDKNRITGRAQFLWTPDSDLTARLIIDGSYHNQTGPDTYVPATYGASRAILTALGANTALGLQDRLVTLTTSRDPREKNGQYGVSLELNWTRDWGKLTSITAYRRWNNYQEREVDYTELDIVNNIPAHQRFRNFSQELRVDGSAGKLDWLVGAFYTHENVYVSEGYKFGADAERYIDALLSGGSLTARPISVATGLPVGQSLPDGAGLNQADFYQKANSLSFFTHNSYRLASRLTLTAGLRWTTERKALSSTLADGFNPGCDALVGRGVSSGSPFNLVCLLGFDPRYEGNYQAKKKESEFSGVASLMFELNDNINSYISYSRGYKGGGFVLDVFGYSLVPGVKQPSGEDLKFDPEFADNFEFGLKTQLFDRKLRANLAVFYTKLTDYQLTYNTGAAIFTRNVPEVTSKGFELETEFRPTNELRGTFGVTYANTRYGKIPAISGLPATLVTGARLYNAPLWTINGTIGWDGKILNDRLRLYTHAGGRYVTDVKVERSLARGSDQEGFVTVDARIGLGAPDQSWTVELWARNLFNKRYFVSQINATFQSGTLVGLPGEPRMFGASIMGRW